jgi:hypothetical protein
MIAIAFLLLALVAAAPSAADSTGIVGHWKLDERSGTTVLDSSGLGDNGTMSGGATWVNGSSVALRFDGATGSVRVSDSSSLEPASTVSVGAWVEHTGSPGSYRYVLAKGAASCIAGSYGLYTGPNGGLEFYVSRNHGSLYARSPDAGTGVWDGRWHFVVGTFDGTTIRMFVDGNQISTGTQYPGRLEYLLGDANDLFIGNYPGCQLRNFLGDIRDVTVWNRALTPTEISAASAGLNGTPSVQPAIGQTPPGPSSTGQSSPARHPPGTGTEGAQGARAPALRLLTVYPSTFSTDPGNHPNGHRGSTGATISYTATRPGRATFVILLTQAGVFEHGRCIKPANSHGRYRRAHCTRYTTLNRFTHVDRVGRNTIHFPRPHSHKLAPGSYRLRATPGAHAQAGPTVTALFTIVP